MNDQSSEKTEAASPKSGLPGWVQARKLVVGVIGFTVLIVGICLLVLPGPAFIVIPAGLAILATEFIWARRWLRKAKKTFKGVKDACFNGNSHRTAQDPEKESENLPNRRS
jgi:tellurite resistance protein TerC